MSAQLITDLSEQTDQYDVFLIDAWGVLHDGYQLYPGVRETLTRLKAANRQIIIISNAARRHSEFKLELDKLGLGEDLYSDVVTSGELTWQAFQRQSDVVTKLGRRYFYQGPQRSRELMQGLYLDEVDGLEQAEFILNTGAEGNHTDASAFETLLQDARGMGLAMVCANPDQLAIRGGVPGISAGAIAKSYERLGGEVIYFGKPHPPIYEQCFALYPDKRRTQFLMLGDGLATDIRGANNAAIDSVFLSSGIHAAELEGDTPATLEKLYAHYQAYPTFVMNSMQSGKR